MTMTGGGSERPGYQSKVKQYDVINEQPLTSLMSVFGISMNK